MDLLTGTNLVVKIDNATPVADSAGPWAGVSYPQGNNQNPIVYQRLEGGVGDVQSFGTFALNGLMTGIRGTLVATLVIGAPGSDRAIGSLSQTLGSSNKILLAIDALNRP